nr:hypothetical protein [uncultured bacterium]
MKKLIYLFLALIIVACTTDDNNNVDDTQAEWLYVHTAIDANATNSTTLVMPVTNDIFAFTDRPNREHKYISAEEFVSYWSEDATNSFQFDPPNAVFTSVSDDGVAEVEVVIIGANTDGDNITYTIQNPKLTENATFVDVSLFVDGNGDNNLVIGQSYQGGIIAYIDSSGKHGLIAATEDHNGELSWYDAMNYCNALTVGQYDDWHLPSKDELNRLYEKQTAIGGFTGDYYWSSTEYNFYNAWYQYFVYGNQSASNKNYPGYVRAVRAF